MVLLDGLLGAHPHACCQQAVRAADLRFTEAAGEAADGRLVHYSPIYGARHGHGLMGLAGRPTGNAGRWKQWLGAMQPQGRLLCGNVVMDVVYRPHNSAVSIMPKSKVGVARRVQKVLGYTLVWCDLMGGQR